MLTETQRVIRLAKDLSVRTLTCFAISIAIGWFALRVLHLGTAASVGAVCGSITIGLFLASLAGWPPAYFNKFTDDADAE